MRATTIKKRSPVGHRAAMILMPLLILFSLYTSCYVLDHEKLQGRSPSIFYIEAFERNDLLYPYPGDIDRYEQLEPSYTYAGLTEIFFLLYLDDDNLSATSFSDLAVDQLFETVPDSGEFTYQTTYHRAVYFSGILQIYGTLYFTLPGTTGTYKYVFTVTDNDGNASEPAEVLITVE